MRCYSGKTWGLNLSLTRLIYRTIIVPVMTYGLLFGTRFSPARSLATGHSNTTAENASQFYRTASIISTNLSPTRCHWNKRSS